MRHEITLDVIMQTVFGLSQGQRYQQIKPLLADWLDILNSPTRVSFIFPVRHGIVITPSNGIPLVITSVSASS